MAELVEVAGQGLPDPPEAEYKDAVELLVAAEVEGGTRGGGRVGGHGGGHNFDHPQEIGTGEEEDEESQGVSHNFDLFPVDE